MGGEPRELPDRYARVRTRFSCCRWARPLLLVHGADDATISIAKDARLRGGPLAPPGDSVGLAEPQPGGHRSHVDPRSPAWRAGGRLARS